MSDLNHVFEDVPQILINCRVKRRADLSELAGYNDMIRNIEKKLAGNGRVFVRFSGTEPVIRVLVEGTDKTKITQLVEEIASFLGKKNCLNEGDGF